MMRRDQPTGFNEEEVQLLLRLCQFRLDIKGWLTPEEQGKIGRIQERLHNDAIRLNNERVHVDPQ